jgi:hypothetical protein
MTSETGSVRSTNLSLLRKLARMPSANQPLVIAGRSFRSRLILGAG